MLRIGVDVGGEHLAVTVLSKLSLETDLILIIIGTNTDGVLIDVTRTKDANRGVLSHFKAPTTLNVSDGIEEAVRQVLKTADVSASSISCVSIGTTAFVNAVLERDARRLEKVAVIRLCGPYTRQCPPFIDFPPALEALTRGHVGYVDGGFESKFPHLHRNTASALMNTSRWEGDIAHQ